MPKGKVGFQKGHKLSPGRPKGSKNMTTWQKEFFLKYIEEEGAPELIDTIKMLEDKDKAHYLTALLPYAFAKRAPVDDKGKTAQQILVMPSELMEKNDIKKAE